MKCTKPSKEGSKSVEHHLFPRISRAFRSPEPLERALVCLYSKVNVTVIRLAEVLEELEDIDDRYTRQRQRRKR